MRTLTDGLIGVLARPTYRMEVWKMGAPKQQGSHPDGDYVYLTKIHSNGEIGERSVGIPEKDINELKEILTRLPSPAPTGGVA